MTVFITLTIAGTDTGPFDLYSNLDGYTIPFETGVAKATLEAGYLTALVPDYTGIIRVKSVGDCENYIDILLENTTTTSTSTTSTSSTTTTTTTTIAPACTEYTVITNSKITQQVGYIDCYGIEQSFDIIGPYSGTICALEGSLFHSPEVFSSPTGVCTTTTTTTVPPTTTTTTTI